MAGSRWPKSPRVAVADAYWCQRCRPSASRTNIGEVRSIEFVRADTSPSQEAAAQMSLDKARKIVDERGDAVFDADRA